MKVLFFNYEYPPLGGGAANATEQILLQFSKIPDLEVDLVTSSIDADYHLGKLGERIRIHKLPIGKNSENLHFQSQKDLLVYSWRAYFFARKLAAENKYDLSHSFFSVPCGFLSLVFKHCNKLPYIVSLRGSDVPGYSDRFTFVYALLTPLIKLIWRNADYVVSNSQGLKDLALRTGTKKDIAIIHNGIDTETFCPQPELRPAGSFIVTPGASRVTTRKGIKYLIEAVAELAIKYPQIALKIIGDGNEKKNLEQLVIEKGLQKNVIFLGRVPHDKVTPFYQEAGVFVLPSLNEGMSNAMLEALAAGLPILATDTGGSKELVKDGVNGYIIKMKDSSDITTKLEKIMTDEKLRESMSRASRELAENMSWEKVARQYAGLYKATDIRHKTAQ